MKLLTSALVGAALFAGQAVAGSLSIIGGTEATLPANYGIGTDIPGVGVGSSVLTFTGSELSGAGLELNGDSELSFTYLGHSAAASNDLVELAGGQSMNNKTASYGDSISADFVSGLVDFAFNTDWKGGGSIENGVGTTGGRPLNLTFLKEHDHSVLVFFGDGAGDLDMDDMVIRVSTVPLPAGALLMLTAVGGLGVASRRKKS